MSRAEKVRQWLRSPKAPWVAALLAVALFSPSLGGGYMLDDYTIQLAFHPGLVPPGGPTVPLALFRFQDTDRSYLQNNMDRGLWPWWTAPQFRLAFFRPLTSLTHSLDYEGWPAYPALMHAEELLLYALLTFVTALLYRRLLPAAPEE